MMTKFNEADHPRNRGKFTTKARTEGNLDFDQERREHIKDVAAAYYAEQWGTDRDPKELERLANLGMSMDSDLIPVDVRDEEGLDSHYRQVKMVDEDGIPYRMDLVSTFSVTAGGARFSKSKWEADDPARMAERYFVELWHDRADEEDSRAWNSDPDGYVIKKLAEKREELDKKYSPEGYAEMEQYEHDHPGMMMGGWRRYQQCYSRWPELKALADKREEYRKDMKINVDNTTRVAGFRGYKALGSDVGGVDTKSFSNWHDAHKYGAEYRQNATEHTRPEIELEGQE